MSEVDIQGAPPPAVPEPSPEPPAPSAPSPSARAGLSLPIAIGLVFLVALGVRYAAMSPRPDATARETAVLGATDAESSGVDRPDASVQLVGFLRRFGPEPAIPNGAIAGLPPTLAPAISRARILYVVFGAIGAALLTWAAARRGGLAAGLMAGGLLALSTAAVAGSTSADAGGFLLAVSPLVFALFAAGPLSERPGRATAAGAGLGAALAAGGGGLGLWLGVPWVTRGGRMLPRILLGIGAGIAYALASGAARTLPRTVGAEGLEVNSPLVAGIGLLAQSAGPLATVLAVFGAVRVLKSGDAGGRAILAATVGAFLTALLRDGADVHSLAVALPGVFLLAGHSLAAPASGRLVPLRAAFVIAALAIAAFQSAHLIVSRWARPPQDAAAEWIRRNFPPNAAFLLEDPQVLVATPAGLVAMQVLVEQGVVSEAELQSYAEGSKTFSPIPLPPPDVDPIEQTLFYDPNLTPFVSRLVLRDPPPSDDEAPAELATTRKVFHEYFRETWTELAKFPAGRSRRTGIIILQRPEDFTDVDRARLGTLAPILDSPVMSEKRDTSEALTHWLRDGGAALRASGEFIGARAWLELATRRDSTDAETLVQLSLVHIQRNRLSAAKEALVKGLELDPFHGGIHYNLAVVLEAEGDLVGAETEYRAAISYLENAANAHARLGALLVARGDVAAARDQLDALRAIDPNGEDTRMLEELLRSS